MKKAILRAILSIILAYLLTNLITLPLLILHEWGHAIVGLLMGCEVKQITYRFGVTFNFKYIPFYTYSGETILKGCPPSYPVLIAGFVFSVLVPLLIALTPRPFRYLSFPVLIICFMTSTHDFVMLGIPTWVFNEDVMLILYCLSYFPFIYYFVRE